MQAVQAVLASISDEFQHSSFTALPTVVRVLRSTDRDLARESLVGLCLDIDRATDALVDEYHGAFNESFRSFAEMFKAVNNSRDIVELRLADVNASTEQTTVHATELERLQRRVDETREMLRLLGKIEEVQQIPGALQALLQERRFIMAVEVASRGYSLILDEDLLGIHALSEIRKQLVDDRNALHESLTSELEDVIYGRHERVNVASMLADGDDAGVAVDLAPPASASAAAGSAASANASEANKDKRRLRVRKKSSSNVGQELQRDQLGVYVSRVAKDEPADASNPLLALSVVSLALQRLDRLKFAITMVIKRLQLDVHAFLDACVVAVKDFFAGSDQRKKTKLAPLELLLRVVSARSIALLKNHRLFLDVATQILQQTPNAADAGLYNISLVWSTLQLELQSLLALHLGSDSTQGGAATIESTRENFLFQFGHSLAAAHASASTSSFRMRKAAVLPPELVPRTPENVIHVFKQVQRICDEADTVTRSEKRENMLREFVDDAIQHHLIPHIREQQLRFFFDVVDVPGAFQAHEYAVSSLGGGKLVHSAPSILELCRSILRLIRALPPYSTELLGLLTDILQRYIGRARSKYTAVHTGVLANEITTQLVEDEAGHTVRTGSSKDVQSVIFECVKRAHVESSDLLPEGTAVALLCMLMTTMDWLYVQLALMFSAPAEDNRAEGFRGLRAESMLLPLDLPWLSADVQAKAQSLRKLSDTIRVVLFSHCRLLCAYHFGRLAPSSFAGDDVPSEPEPPIAHLLRSLANLDETLQHFLSRHDISTIFLGLPDFAARLLLHFVRSLSQINAAGVEKLVRNISAIQQKFSTVTGTSAKALARLKSFVELLVGKEDRILAHAPANRTFFSLDDYRWIMEMRAGRGRAIDAGTLHSIRAAISQ